MTLVVVRMFNLGTVNEGELPTMWLRPEFLLLVDLQDFFSDLGSGTEKKKKSSENDQLTGHFQSFFFIFRAFFFLNISRTNS